MTQNTNRYRTYVTQTGFGLEALANQQGTKVDFAKLVVGDGELPDSSNPANQTDLINQVRHYPVTIEVDDKDPTIWVARAEIPAEDGGFYIREAGVKIANENGSLYSYSRQPGDYKPVLEEGSSKSYTIRLKFIPGNASVIEAKIDPSVQFATPTDLSNAIKVHEEKKDPHVQYAKVNDLNEHKESNAPHEQYLHSEEQRIINLDHYEHTAFLFGFDVLKEQTPNQYKIAPGVVYIGGLRAQLFNEQLIDIRELGKYLYVDVVRKADGLSPALNYVSILVSAVDENDYIDDDGLQHFVAKIAEITTSEEIIYYREKGKSAGVVVDCHFGISSGYILYGNGILEQYARWSKPAGSTVSVTVKLPLTYGHQSYRVWSSAENGVFPLSQSAYSPDSVILGYAGGNGGYWLNPQNVGSGTIYTKGVIE